MGEADRGCAVSNTLRVQVVKTTRTDLLCIHCGGFGGPGRLAMLAIVAPTVAERDAQAGVHRACIRLVKARRAPSTPATSPAAADAGKGEP